MYVIYYVIRLVFENHCDVWKITEREPTNSCTLKSRWGEKTVTRSYDGIPFTRQ